MDNSLQSYFSFAKIRSEKLFELNIALHVKVDLLLKS